MGELAEAVSTAPSVVVCPNTVYAIGEMHAFSSAYVYGKLGLTRLRDRPHYVACANV